MYRSIHLKMPDFFWFADFLYASSTSAFLPYNPQAYQQRNVFYLAVPVIPVLVPVVHHDTRYFVLSEPPRQQTAQP